MNTNKENLMAFNHNKYDGLKKYYSIEVEIHDRV